MRIVLALLLACGVAGFPALPGHATDSYTVNAGQTLDITEFSECRSVTNSHPSGLGIMVPTKTQAEWQSFYDHAGAGVTAGSCAPSGGGGSASGDGGSCGFITSGYSRSCAVGTDNKAYCWGRNDNGQLGDGGSGIRTTPYLALNGAGPGTYKMLVTTGDYHTCGIGTDDKAYCWGANTNNQLGDGTTTARSSPILVPNGAGPGTYKILTQGGIHTCAIGTDDKLYCWGANNQGQLGTGNYTNGTTPVLTLNGAGPGAYKAITGGNGFTCGIGTDNKAYCWGLGNEGQIGDNTTVSKNVPTLVLNGAGPGTYKAIDAGRNFVCAIGTDDKAYCWGGGSQGQLGNGATSQSNLPVLVNTGTGPGTYKSINGGWYHTCAIGTDDKAYCWGQNTYNQLGDGTTTQRTSPVAVSNGASPGTFTSITAADMHSCARGTDNKLYCWGYNATSQLGDGSVTQRSTAVLTSNGSGPGTYATCSSGGGGGGATTLYCWGYNDEGLYGNASTTTSLSATDVSVSNIAQVSVGSSHTCILDTAGIIKCTGDNTCGMLGTGNTTSSTTFAPLTATGGYSTTVWSKVVTNEGVASSPASIAATNTCAIRASDSKLFCWGGNGFGQVGNGASGTNITSPTQVGTASWKDVSIAGQGSTCGIQSDDTLWCWGNGQYSVNLNPAATNRTSPTKIGSATWKKVSMGRWFGCGLQTNNTIWCWGNNALLQVVPSPGGSPPAYYTTPQQLNADTNWATLEAGGSHTCATKSNGTLWCWGSNQTGEMGQGTTGSSPSAPIQVGTGTNWTSVMEGGNEFRCAKKSDNTLWCWGNNFMYGMIGQGSSNSEYTAPTQVSSLANISLLSAGHSTACAVADTGGGGSTSFTYVSTSTSASDTNRIYEIPNEAQAGDLAVFVYGGYVNGSGVILNAPSGWTKIYDATANTDSIFAVTAKKLTAADISSGTVTWTVASGSPGQVEKLRAMSIFRPATSFSTIGKSTWQQAWTTGNPSAQTIAANSHPSPSIAFAYAYTSNGSVPWTTFSPTQDQTIVVEDATSSFEFRFKLYDSAPQSTSADMGDGGNNNLMFSGVIYVQ